MLDLMISLKCTMCLAFLLLTIVSCSTYTKFFGDTVKLTSTVDNNEINQLPIACGDDSEGPGSSAQAYDLSRCFPASVGNNPTPTSAIRSAYKQFYALNWDVMPNQVGIANSENDIKDVVDTFSVWQSWPTTNQAYLMNIKTKNIWPKRWEDTTFIIPSSCQYIFEKHSGHSIYGEFIENQGSYLAGPKVQVLTNDLNPDGKQLIDSLGRPAYFQVYLNKVAFDYLRNVNFYKNEKFQESMDFPLGNFSNTQRGSVFVKAAWKLLTDSEAEDYHTAAALIVTNPGVPRETCDLKLVGLSGLHILNKNNSNSLYQDNLENKWTWATYEFIDNAPYFDDVVNGSIAPTLGQWGFFSATSINDPNYKALKLGCETDKTQWDLGKPSCDLNKFNTAKSEIVKFRQDKFSTNLIEGYTEQALKRLQKSVWKNYRIINTQWQNGPNHNDLTPKVVASSVLESFDQEIGCSQCHRDAGGSPAKFDFVFLNGAKKLSVNDWIPIDLVK